MKTQFVTNEKGKKIAVILPIDQYQKMIEELEEIDDVRLYDQAKAEGGEKILFNDYLKQRKGKK